VTGSNLTCMCSGCAACGPQRQHEFRWGGDPKSAPPFCTACTREYAAGQAAREQSARPAAAGRRAVAALLERRSQPPGGNAMSESLSGFFGTLGPGHNRRLTVAEMMAKQRQAAELEQRAARVPELERRAERAEALQVYEPPVYGVPGGPSYLQDLARVVLRGPLGEPKRSEAAADRLHRHQLAQHRENERRLRALRAEAEYATEQALSQTSAEAALLHRWQAAGGHAFEYKHKNRDMNRQLDAEVASAGIQEKRALSRTDGSGGYFTSPGWLVDQFVPGPRAGSPFANLWQRLPMPAGVSSINLPRFKTGLQSGAMIDGASVPSGGGTDSALTANLVTLAAQADVSLQWVDQSPAPAVDTLGGDLAADFMIQLDGQLLLGSGASGQAQGVISAGTLAAANLIWLKNTNNTAAMTWANGGGASPAIAGSIHESAAMLKAKIAYYRGRSATAYVMNEATWSIYSAAADSQQRPLNHGDGPPMLHNIPVILDQNLPSTFGGASAPVIGVSSGVTSPTDGNGTWAPILCGRWQDCILWQSEPQIRVMLQVLSGSLQARFQVYCYVAAAPNRVVWGGSNATFSAANQGGGVNAGAAVAYAGLSQYTSNSVLQPAAAGFAA
jgi:HK97 family phage major capsid protein